MKTEGRVKDSKQQQQIKKIDTLMESASQALVARRYFETARACVQALELALTIRDFERMARITLPLQEARRQIRETALDSDNVVVIDAEVPTAENVKTGMYLVQPPRVGVDGRALREAAEAAQVPVVVIVREPRTRDGLWPVVAVGPVTVRTKVRPPAGVPETAPGPELAPHRALSEAAAAAEKSRGKKSSAQQAAFTVASEPRFAPPREWFVAAGEALGDMAFEDVQPGAHPATRVESLLMRLQAVPDHEKLHQHLADACREAAVHPDPGPRARQNREFEDELDDDEIAE